MSFVLSGSILQTRVFEFRPVEYNTVYGIGNYIQSLRDMCYSSNGFVDATRVYNRFKIEGGHVKITLYSFVSTDNEISYNTATLYGLIGAVRYGKNLNSTVPPNAVYEQSNWLFPANPVRVDRAGRLEPYSESITIPIKTGFTTFKKCFGDLYNILIALGLSVKGPTPNPVSNYHNDFDMSLQLDWEFLCVGEGSSISTIDWVPCMLFSVDRKQGVPVRGIM